MPATELFRFGTAPVLRNMQIRFPDPGDPVEEAFATSNRLRRQQSIQRLEYLLPDFDWRRQANSTDDATLIVTKASLDALNAFRVPEALDSVAICHDPGAGLVNLPGGGGGQAPLPSETRRLFVSSGQQERFVTGAVSGMIHDDSTVIVNGLDRVWEPLQQLTTDLVTTFASGSNTNCYISRGASEGFGAHWDDHDVVILHTEGRKYWEIFAPTALSAMRTNIGPEVGPELVWSGDLTPGDALFIPRGWGHRVENYDSLSVHLTVSINRHSVIGILNYLVSDATNWPILRADTPYDFDELPSSYLGSVFDEPNGIVRHLEPLMPDLVERALAMTRSTIPVSGAQSWSATLQAVVNGRWDDVIVEAPFPGGVMVADVPDDGDVALAMGGFVVTISRGLAGLVAAAHEEPRRVRDLAVRAPYLDEESLHAVVEGLVRAGVLHVVSMST